MLFLFGAMLAAPHRAIQDYTSFRYFFHFVSLHSIAHFLSESSFLSLVQIINIIEVYMELKPLIRPNEKDEQ